MQRRPIAFSVYYIYAVIINVYRKNVTVVTTIKGDTRFQKVTIPKGKFLEINTSFPALLQKDQLVSIVAFDQFNPIRINGMNSASFYVSKTPVKAPRIFYVEERPTLESPSEQGPSAKPSATTQLPLAEFASSETSIKTSNNTSSPYPRFTENHSTKPILTSLLSSKETYEIVANKSSSTSYSHNDVIHSDFLYATASSKGSSSNIFPKKLSSKAVAETTGVHRKPYLTTVNRVAISTGEVSSGRLPTINVLSPTIPLQITSPMPFSTTPLLVGKANENFSTTISNFQFVTKITSEITVTETPVTTKPLMKSSPVFTSTDVSFATTHSVHLYTTRSKTVPVVATMFTISSTKRPSTEVCPKVTNKTAWGVFSWPDTKAGSKATIPCPYDENSTATRECEYVEYSRQFSWGKVDAKRCPYVNETSRKIFHLSKVPVNYGNVRTVAQEIQKLSSFPDKLLPQDVSNTATVLENIVVVGKIPHEVTDEVLNTIDNVLDAKLEVIVQSQETKNSSSRILQSLTNVLDNLNVNVTGSFDKSLRNFAVGVTVINSSRFSGVLFSASIKKQAKDGEKEIILTKLTSNITIGTSTANATAVYLPQTIFSETTRAQVVQVLSFVVYKKTAFFQTVPLTAPSHNPLKGQLGSYIMAAKIKDYSVSNLKNPVRLHYPRLNKTDLIRQTCVFWSPTQQRWSDQGCSFQGFSKDGRIICDCNHLTNFAILIDISIGEESSHEKTLSIISYIGCSLSLLGMVLTITTILMFRDLRRTVPLQILLNFCIALSLTLIVFLAAAERRKTTSLTICRAAAIALHYFSLSVFMWMAILAFNMYRLFVQILVSHVSRFLLKCCVVAWGVPAIIVSITVGLALDHYGDTKYCRLTGIPFLVAFCAPIGIILVGNLIAFVIIFRSLLTAGNRVSSHHKKDGVNQVRQGAAIMILLGLTWVFGAFAIKDAKVVFQYLFCIVNSIQGLLVFIFYCVLPATVRGKYKNAYKTKATSRFGDESGRAILNMDTTESYKTGTFGRDDKVKSPIRLTNVKSRTPELHRLTDTFGHQIETVM